ncbi:hypothetical protein DBR06_SOUSAS9610109 [Sousa chinensis]|nr:hypothetical protein DBR06_SOUSAS9610109 [Sousa chinensis]
MPSVETLDIPVKSSNFHEMLFSLHYSVEAKVHSLAP